MKIYLTYLRYNVILIFSASTNDKKDIMVLAQSKEGEHSWSSEQWIGLCNVVLLFLVTFFCGMVLYEIQSLDQRFISVIDSSRIAIDLTSVDLIDPHSQPSWKDVSDELRVYSAFYDHVQNHVLIIGSSVESEIQLDDIRCLVQYEDGDMSLVNVNQRKEMECSTVFAYCFLERDLLPVKVALVSVENTIPKQWMNVEMIPESMTTEPNQKVAACFQLLNEIVSPQYLKSYIILNEMAGVEQFYIYYHNVSREIFNVFLELTSEGHLIHILSWNKEENISNKCPKECSEFVQDCSHRSSGKHKYVNILNISDARKHLSKISRSMLVQNLTDIARY